MRKLITLILILAMFLPAIALADLPDISGLSHDELIQLNHQIQLRLFSEQLVNGVKVPPGTYTIGEDIPAGSYRVEVEGENGMYAVYDANGEPTDSSLCGSFHDVLEFGKLILTEGTTFEIKYTTFVLYPYSGLFH